MILFYIYIYIFNIVGFSITPSFQTRICPGSCQGWGISTYRPLWIMIYFVVALSSCHHPSRYSWLGWAHDCNFNWKLCWQLAVLDQPTPGPSRPCGSIGKSWMVMGDNFYQDWLHWQFNEYALEVREKLTHAGFMVDADVNDRYYRAFFFEMQNTLTITAQWYHEQENSKCTNVTICFHFCRWGSGEKCQQCCYSRHSRKIPWCLIM